MRQSRPASSSRRRKVRCGHPLTDEQTPAIAPGRPAPAGRALSITKTPLGPMVMWSMRARVPGIARAWSAATPSMAPRPWVTAGRIRAARVIAARSCRVRDCVIAKVVRRSNAVLSRDSRTADRCHVLGRRSSSIDAASWMASESSSPGRATRSGGRGRPCRPTPPSSMKGSRRSTNPAPPRSTAPPRPGSASRRAPGRWWSPGRREPRPTSSGCGSRPSAGGRSGNPSMSRCSTRPL